MRDGLISRLEDATTEDLHGHAAEALRDWRERTHNAVQLVETWRLRALGNGAELDDARVESLSLVTAMALQSNAPVGWRPLPTVAGMISQISNMVAGLRERADKAEIERIRAWNNFRFIMNCDVDTFDDLRRRCEMAEANRERLRSLLRELRDGDHIYGNDAEPLLVRVEEELDGASDVPMVACKEGDS